MSNFAPISLRTKLTVMVMFVGFIAFSVGTLDAGWRKRARRCCVPCCPAPCESAAAAPHGSIPAAVLTPATKAPEATVPEALPSGEAPPPPSAETPKPEKNLESPESPSDVKPGATSLFNGKNLDGWKITEFGGQGKVTVEKGEIKLPFGQDLTGVNYAGEAPKENYELSLDAKRTDGNDFFCGLTFPIGDSSATFVVGGWGGGVIGLSSVDGMDASENTTTKYQEFKTDQWYHIRARVTKEKVECWIDDKQFVEQTREGHKFSVRIEVDRSRPLGIASWRTSSAVKNIQLEKLADEPAAKDAAKKEAEPAKSAEAEKPVSK